MLDRELLESKAAEIDHYIEELRALVADDPFDILRNHERLHAIERLFQLIVDTMVAMNTHVIAAADFPVPEDYQNTFVTLGEHGVLPMDFAVRLAPVVGLRNRVVHKYEELDMHAFLLQLRTELGDVPTYLRHVLDYAERQRPTPTS